MIEQYNFTPSQLKTILAFYEWIYECRKQESLCKVEALQVFKDDENNFYASYYVHGQQQGNPVSVTEYIKVDADGTKTYLLDTYKSETALARKFDTFQKIVI